MLKKSIGAKIWLIPDSYLPTRHNGEIESHETVCVLNLSRRPAKLKFTFFFEDRAPIRGCEAACPPERTMHIAVKRLKGSKGETDSSGKVDGLRCGEQRESCGTAHARRFVPAGAGVDDDDGISGEVVY